MRRTAKCYITMTFSMLTSINCWKSWLCHEIR